MKITFALQSLLSQCDLRFALCCAWVETGCEQEFDFKKRKKHVLCNWGVGGWGTWGWLGGGGGGG